MARWRAALVAGSLTATLGVVGLVGAQVAHADGSGSDSQSVVSTTSSSDSGSSGSSSGSSSSSGSDSGLSSGSSSGSYDATSGGS